MIGKAMIRMRYPQDVESLTATVKSGVPKHFSSDWAVSHVDDQIRTESNAVSEKGFGPEPQLL